VLGFEYGNFCAAVFSGNSTPMPIGSIWYNKVTSYDIRILHYKLIVVSIGLFPFAMTMPQMSMLKYNYFAECYGFYVNIEPRLK